MPFCLRVGISGHRGDHEADRPERPPKPEVGPGLLNHSNLLGAKGSQFGGQAVFGGYLGQSGAGAFRLAASVGGYFGDGNYSVPILANAAYELNLSPVRLRLGPVAGVTYIDMTYTTVSAYSSPYYSFYLYGSENYQKFAFTYGGQVGLSFDVAENVYLALDYKYLRLTETMVKDDNVHSISLGLGFNF